jgi:hypothetical protein
MATRYIIRTNGVDLDERFTSKARAISEAESLVKASEARKGNDVISVRTEKTAKCVFEYIAPRFPIGTKVRVANKGLGNACRKETERVGEFEGVVTYTGECRIGTEKNWSIPAVIVQATDGTDRAILVGDLELVPEDLTGHYEPSAPGAKTIRDARPLYLGDKHVTVEVTDRTAYLYVGGTFTKPFELPDHFTGADVNPWAQEMIANGYDGEPEGGNPVWDTDKGDWVDVSRETEHEYVVTGAIISPSSRFKDYFFRDVVKATSHEHAIKIVHAQYSARLDPDFTGEGDIFNFYVHTTGDRWYGWVPEDEDDLGWGDSGNRG